MNRRTPGVWVWWALAVLADGQPALDPRWQQTLPAPIVWAAPIAPAAADAALVVALVDGRWLALDAATGAPRGPLLDLGPGLAPLNAGAAAPPILVASAAERLVAVTVAPALSLCWERRAGALDPALFQGDPEYLPLWRVAAANDRYVAALKTTGDASVFRLADGALQRTLFAGPIGDARLCLWDDQLAVLGSVRGQPRVAFSAVTRESSYALGTSTVLAAWLTDVGLVYATLREIGVVRPDGTRETRTLREPLQALRLALGMCAAQAGNTPPARTSRPPPQLLLAQSQRVVAYDLPSLEQAWAIDLPAPTRAVRLAAADGAWQLVDEGYVCVGTCDGRAARGVQVDAARVLGVCAGDDGTWVMLQQAGEPPRLLLVAPEAAAGAPPARTLRGAPAAARTAQWLPGYCFIVAQQQVCGYKLPQSSGAADEAAQSARRQVQPTRVGPAPDRASGP